MTLETYWLVIAPAGMLALSAVGWVGLWLTRDKSPDHQRTSLKQ